MKQNEVKAFLAKANEKEAQAQNLLETKIQEFLEAKDNISKELVILMNELFPAEIEELFREIWRHSGSYADDKLRINFSNGKIIAKLHSAEDINIIADKDAIYFDDSPSNMNQLIDASKKLQNYILLKTELTNKIETFYDTITNWKEEKLRDELETLNSFQFITKENTSKEDEILKKVTQLFKDEKVNWHIDKHAHIVEGEECIECNCSFFKEFRFKIYVPSHLFKDIEKNGIKEIENYLAKKITEWVKTDILHLI